MNEDVLEHQRKASKDPRPSFVHGRTLISQFYWEVLSWLVATCVALGKAFWRWLTCQDDGIFREVGDEHELNAKARGWLRFLYRKATTKDDWSIDGEPHPWWDRYSNAPMMNFPRFDCSESSYFVLLAAEKLPAWREVFVEIFDGLLVRYTSFWGAVDYLTQFGYDLKRSKYPWMWRGMLIPGKTFGQMDTPGWVAHGVANPAWSIPSAIYPDPIEAPSYLFYKGFLSLLMGIRERVGGDGRWRELWNVTGVGGEKFPWTYERLCAHLSKQYNANGGAGLH